MREKAGGMQQMLAQERPAEAAGIPRGFRRGFLGPPRRRETHFAEIEERFPGSREAIEHLVVGLAVRPGDAEARVTISARAFGGRFARQPCFEDEDHVEPEVEDVY